MTTQPSATITTLGSSDAFNSGGRGNSCFFVRDAQGAYALDFGPSAPLIARRLGLDLSQLDVVYLTHLHGDHIGGLPSLLLELTFEHRRTRALTIAGPVGTERVVKALYELLYPGTFTAHLCFELSFVEWPLSGTQVVAGRRVISRPAQHDERVSPTSLRIEQLSDLGPTLAFSGDTGWCASLIEVARNADVLICECSFVEKLFDGHLSLEEIKKDRQKLEVNRLILTHLSEASREAALKESETSLLEVADDGVVFHIHSRTAHHPDEETT